jgi:hypothetical protein
VTDSRDEFVETFMAGGTVAFNDAEREKMTEEKPDGARAYYELFGDIPLRLRIAYRIPVVIVVLVIAIILTFILPYLAGFVMYGALAIMLGLNDAPVWLATLSAWLVGLVSIGGATALGVVMIAFWSSALDTIKSAWRFLRAR